MKRRRTSAHPQNVPQSQQPLPWGRCLGRHRRDLYACVTRERPEGGPKNGWEPQEKISPEDCIRAYTSGSAYAQFEEGKKGELKPGEYADFIVLFEDLTKISPTQYTKVRVFQTVAGGHTVYQSQ